MASETKADRQELEIKPGDIILRQFAEDNPLAGIIKPIFQFGRDNANRIFIHGEGGSILTRDEWSRLLPLVNAFYERYTDIEIEELNSAIDMMRAYGSVLSERAPAPGFIYVVKCDGKYKIGRTKDHTKRIARFATIYPHELTVIHVARVDDMASMEAALHERFNAQRERGEWFSLSESDLQTIAAMLPDVVEVRS